MEIRLDIKVPEEFEGAKREERVQIDIETAISVVHSMIPEEERTNIKIRDGTGIMHKYESFAQIEEMYRRDNKIGMIYVGSDSEFEK